MQTHDATLRGEKRSIVLIFRVNQAEIDIRKPVAAATGAGEAMVKSKINAPESKFFFCKLVFRS